MAMLKQVCLGRACDLSEGEARGFDPFECGRDTLFVVRKDDAWFGWYDRCPHEGVTPLPYRRHAYLDAAGEFIVCYAHGARFDIRTGQCVKGACKGESLSPVELSVDERGQLMALLDESHVREHVPGTELRQEPSMTSTRIWELEMVKRMRSGR